MSSNSLTMWCVCQVGVKRKVTWITLPIVEVRQLKRARALQDADDGARGRGRGVGRGHARAGRGHGLRRKPLKKKALSKILGCLYNSVLSMMVSFFLAFLHVTTVAQLRIMVYRRWPVFTPKSMCKGLIAGGAKLMLHFRLQP